MLNCASVNAWWLGVLGVVALGCAPTIRHETRSIVSASSHPRTDCTPVLKWRPAYRDGAVEVSVWDRELCTSGGFSTRTVQEDHVEYPQPVVLGLEVLAMGAGIALIAEGLGCEHTGEEYSCFGAGLTAATGLVIAIPAATATTVDLFDFGSGSRQYAQHTRLPERTWWGHARPRPGVPVRLELDDGDTVRASTDAQGKARLPVIATPDGKSEFAYGVLYVGAAKKRVRFRR